MATVDWPTAPGFAPARISLGASTPKSAWAAFFTGQRQSLSHLADRLRLEMTLPPCLEQHAGAREAFLLRLARSGDWVRLRHFQRPVPMGTARGTIVTSGAASAGAASVAITGATGAQLAANPGFETDANADGLADGLGSYTGGTVAGVSFSRPAGNGSPAAQRVQATSLGTTANDNAGVCWVATIPVTAGLTYSWAADLQGSTNCHFRLWVDWINSLGSNIGTTNQRWTGTASWQRRSVSGAAPAGAASAIVYVWAEERFAGPTAVDLQVDNVVFQAAPTLLAGDLLGASSSQLLQVAADTTLSDAGAGTVSLVLPLRAALTSGAALTWYQPTGLFQLENLEPAFEYVGSRVQQGLTLTFTEVFA